MTYGYRARNGSDIITVDENSGTYVYLGKWPIDINTGGLSVHCVGYPLIFFGIPYDTVNGGENGAGFGHGFLRTRAGISMTGLQQSAGDPNIWNVNINCNFVNGGNPGQLYVRVFGLLHLNFPNGSGVQWGARMWNQSTGRVYVDSGCRPLRLAGNTYDTELQLPAAVPLDTERADSKDTAVSLPFNMSGKSIMANTRGTVTYPFYTGTYKDSDTQQDVDMYDLALIDTMFWSSGSTLYARRVSRSQSYYERTSGLIVVAPPQVVYTRVAVIDNNLFP